MNRKGQGALEYLLLIGGAILVAIVVITILNSLSGAGGPQANENAARTVCATKPATPNSACDGNSYDPSPPVGQKGWDINVGTTPNRIGCTCEVVAGQCQATSCVRS